MVILVTGGAGFIGSHLCERLLREGQKVICVDSLLTGSKKNIAHLLKQYPSFTFLHHDITKPLSLRVDAVYNLACPASPPHYQRDPIHTLKISTIGVLNMLELARKCNARFLQASTSEVYGDPLEHPQKETYWGHVNPIGPRACYDEGKRVAETFCVEYHERNKLDIRIVRIFNTYGPRMAPDDGRVVSNFIVQALQGKPLTMYGDGSQTRSFCYVDDMVDGLIRMMRSNVRGPVNLGNPHEFSVQTLAKKILQMTHSKSRIVRKTLPIDDPKQRRPDITLAWKKLHWKPNVELTEGLQKTITYFQTTLCPPKFSPIRNSSKK